MAIATTYNHNSGNADGSNARIMGTSSLADQVRAGRRPSLLALNGEYCGACSQCDDVCDNKDCVSCHEKMRKRCPQSPKACAMGGEPTFTMCQIRRHQTPDSAWLVAGGYVYDATDYIAMHPGGDKSILKKCGGACDCSEDLKFHSIKGQKLWKKYRIGKVRPCCQVDDKTWWMFWK